MITADDGTRYPFHGTRITDGTRTIAAGTAVEFAIVPGNLGRWEAAAIQPGVDQWRGLRAHPDRRPSETST